MKYGEFGEQHFVILSKYNCFLSYISQRRKYSAQFFLLSAVIFSADAVASFAHSVQVDTHS